MPRVAVEPVRYRVSWHAQQVVNFRLFRPLPAPLRAPPPPGRAAGAGTKAIILYFSRPRSRVRHWTWNFRIASCLYGGRRPTFTVGDRSRTTADVVRAFDNGTMRDRVAVTIRTVLDDFSMPLNVFAGRNPSIPMLYKTDMDTIKTAKSLACYDFE